MSDVKVKFGAEDVGLEKTLKSIQGELGTLKSKISAGDLSMTELEKTMKRVGQVESLEKRLKGMASEAAQTSPKMDALGKDMKQMADKAADAGDKGSLSFGKLASASAAGGLAVQAGTKVMELAMDAVRAVVEKFDDALDMGGRLNDLSLRTGETAGNVLVLERAFANAGSSAENVGPAINKMQRFMDDAASGGAKQTEAMERLGISMDDLQGKTPTEQMKVFADKIAALKDPTERTALAVDVFGKSGGELLPILSNFSGELETAKGQLGSLPGVMDRSAASFDTISDNLTVMKGKVLEFAAGFLEKAAPSLEKFTNLLSGVDAAGWGQKTMDMILSFSDMLIGVFKSPMPAIEALGLALYAHIAEMGNLYLNSLINGGNFLREFWSSELPSLLMSRLSSSMMKGFADGLKFFVDNIGQVITGFREYFGKAVETVGTFFASTFQNIVGLFANDFKNAMSNPIDFLSGKLESGLAWATKNNVLTFKDEYNNASGSVIDRISKGLGAVSETYGSDLDQSTGKIGEEWDRITGNLKVSSRDFFGAEPATDRLTDKLKEVEDSGRKFREELTNGTGESAAIKKNLEDGANALLNAGEKLSKKLEVSFAQFQQENGIDPGGMREKKFNRQKDAGQNEAAQATLDEIKFREKDQQMRGIGVEKDKRNLQEIARDEGVDIYDDGRQKTKMELAEGVLKKRKDEKEAAAALEREANLKYEQAAKAKDADAQDAAGKLADAKKRQDELKPGKQGEKDKEPGKQESALSGVLDSIRKAVDSIDGKLPLHALGA